MRFAGRLSDVLTNDYGLDLTDRYLGKALAMSADGRFIVGRGYSPTGGGVWLVDLTVPEPSGLVLRALGVVCVFASLRFRRVNRSAQIFSSASASFLRHPF